MYDKLALYVFQDAKVILNQLLIVTPSQFYDREGKFMKRKVWSLIMIAVITSGLLAGCGGSGSTSTSESASGETASVSTAGSSETDTSLTVAATDNIDDLNPFTNQQTSYVALINNNCLETLIRINDKMEYEPLLATEWTVSDDGLDYTFNLREGVTFHDGSPFTSADVKYTLEYTTDEANNAWRRNYFTSISEINCPDDYTVELKLSDPVPALLDSISSLPIVSAKQDASKYSSQLNGTGPFKFVSMTTNDNITFVKYDGYWDADNVKLTDYVIKFFADQTTEINSLQAGDIDLIYGLEPANAGVLESNSNVQVVSSETSNDLYLFEIGLHNVEAFRNQDVLRAIMMCLDTDTIAEDVLYGYASTSKGVVAPSVKYYKEVYTDGYNIEKAKELLASTPYKDGFSFKLTILPRFESVATIWQQALAQIGVTMEIDKEDMSVWLDHYLARDYDMILNEYSMVGTDPSTMMTLIVQQLADYQASPDIIPDLQDKITEAATEVDESKREELYSEIFDLIAEYKPIYPFLNVDNLYASRTNLKGVMFTGEGHYIFDNAYFK